ncbi:MAG: hypothetical protein WAT39_22490 [Planctomycetota bacterium]
MTCARAFLPVLLAAFAGGCATPPPLTLAEAEPKVAAGEALVVAGRFDDALDTLEPLAQDACPKRLRDRVDVARATSLHGQGELWQAFLVLEQFPERNPHSDLRPLVVEKLWQIGQALVRSDSGFLFFWSDERAGRSVLEHLVTRHPDSPRLADALRILGDLAFADENHELAQARFRQLMLERPESEWVGYAQFRFAMSIVASIEGPAYDLDRMEQGQRELRDFLANPPENPEIVRAATAAAAQLLAWRLDRHLRIAAYYRRIDNVAGQLHHLEVAAGPEFAAAPRYAEAVTARNELRASAGASPGGASPP